MLHDLPIFVDINYHIYKVIDYYYVIQSLTVTIFYNVDLPYNSLELERR